VYSPSVANPVLVNSQPRNGHHNVSGSAHIESRARCTRMPVASNIHCFLRRPRLVATSTTTITNDPKSRLWDHSRDVCHVVHIAAPIGVSTRSGRIAPSARKRRSIASSLNAYRTNATVAPTCQKSTRQPTRIARQWMQRGGSCFCALETSAADSFRWHAPHVSPLRRPTTRPLPVSLSPS